METHFGKKQRFYGAVPLKPFYGRLGRTKILESLKIGEV